MLARFEDAGVESTPSAWAVAYAVHVARCYGGDSYHGAREWAAHGLSDVCPDVKSALGVGVTDPSVLVSLPGRPADVGLFGYGDIRGNTVAIDTTIAPILGVSSSDPTTALRAPERHKIKEYDEGVRNAAGMLHFVPFAVSEYGSLAPHAEAFLVELTKASHTNTGQKIGQLLSAWRRRFSLLINMAYADNVLGGVAAARAARDAQQPLDSPADDAHGGVKAGADLPEGTEGATEEGEADAIEEPDAATGGEGDNGDSGPQQDNREVTKLKGTIASLHAALEQQKSKTAAQLNKLKELQAHCGELVLTVEAEDNKWRKLYRTKQRNYNRLAERFGITMAELADAEEEAEREHEANE
eukprot:jgi/Tetstr1/420509/TSEL_001053.t1